MGDGQSFILNKHFLQKLKIFFKKKKKQNVSNVNIFLSSIKIHASNTLKHISRNKGAKTVHDNIFYFFGEKAFLIPKWQQNQKEL